MNSVVSLNAPEKPDSFRQEAFDRLTCREFFRADFTIPTLCGGELQPRERLLIEVIDRQQREVVVSILRFCEATQEKEVEFFRLNAQVLFTQCSRVSIRSRNFFAAE